MAESINNKESSTPVTKVAANKVGRKMVRIHSKGLAQNTMFEFEGQNILFNKDFGAYFTLGNDFTKRVSEHFKKLGFEVKEVDL